MAAPCRISQLGAETSWMKESRAPQKGHVTSFSLVLSFAAAAASAQRADSANVFETFAKEVPWQLVSRQYLYQ